MGFDPPQSIFDPSPAATGLKSVVFWYVSYAVLAAPFVASQASEASDPMLLRTPPPSPLPAAAAFLLSSSSSHGQRCAVPEGTEPADTYAPSPLTTADAAAYASVSADSQATDGASSRSTGV